MKTIIADSTEYAVWNWEEKPAIQIPPAGIHPAVQEAMDNEAAKREGTPKNWDACFGCDATFPRGTVFIAQDGRKFVVSANAGKKHWANRA